MEAEVRWFSDSKKIMCFCIFRVLEAFWLSKAVGVRWKRKKKKKELVIPTSVLFREVTFFSTI